MVDMVRVFRLFKNASVYIEIGTYDKGNLAYASEPLAADAHLIDVDIIDHPDRRELLKKHIKPTQRLTSIIGDSTAQSTVEKVQQALGGQLADGIFIDGNHIAEVVIADYAYYSPLVKPGGFIFFHDVYWAGDEKYFGVSRAIAEIDRIKPVFVVFMHHPVHRFLPWLSKADAVWGGVGMIER
jgi:cephalosporin hydroxylase